MTIKSHIEQLTGIMWQRWDASWWAEEAGRGPRPHLLLAVRPGTTSWARVEIVVGGKGFILTWGNWQLGPGERVDNAMARVPTRGTWGSFRPMPRGR